MFKALVLTICLIFAGAGILTVADTPVLAQEAAHQTDREDPAKPPEETKIISAETVFFGCAFGASIGALATRFPPLVGWTIWAGALPAFTALALTAGLGCAIGLFFNVVLSTVGWVFGGF